MSPGRFMPVGSYMLRAECVGFSFEHQVLVRERMSSDLELEFVSETNEPCQGWSAFNGRALVQCFTEQRIVYFNGACEPQDGPAIALRCNAGCTVLSEDPDESFIEQVPGEFSFDLLEDDVP